MVAELPLGDYTYDRALGSKNKNKNEAVVVLVVLVIVAIADVIYMPLINGCRVATCRLQIRWRIGK